MKSQIQIRTAIERITTLRDKYLIYLNSPVHLRSEDSIQLGLEIAKHTGAIEILKIVLE